MNLWSSPHAFRNAFRTGLVTLAESAELTPAQLVLVLANAVMLGDEPLLAQAKARIQPLVKALPEPGAEGDDVSALRFVQDAPDPLALIHRRVTPAGWHLQLNDLRARRPQRSAGTAATSNHQPYDPATFNFTHVPTEAFWTGEWQGQAVGLYYNKYPIEAYHALLVPQPAAGHEQFLRAADHELAWDFCQTLARHEPGAVVAFNALGAFASVNHLHFQTILGGAELPILQPVRPSPYPATLREFTRPADAWEAVHALQEANQPLNIIYASGRVLVLPRRFQGAYHQPAWTTGFAWYELSGSIIVSDASSYRSLGDADIAAAFRQATIAQA